MQDQNLFALFFKLPICTVYQRRPIDCKTYPVSVELEEDKIIFVIDLKCPAVQKGLVSNKFVKDSIELWQKNIPSTEWLIEYLANDEPKNYEWIKINEYQRKGKKLRK